MMNSTNFMIICLLEDQKPLILFLTIETHNVKSGAVSSVLWYITKLNVDVE